MAKRSKKGRVSAARRRADTHTSGFQTDSLMLPDGLNFWEFAVGSSDISIIAYIAGKGNPEPKIREGDEYFERTYYTYTGIGADEKKRWPTGKTFGKVDYIQEHRQHLMRDPEADPELIKALRPKERQLFLVYDHEDTDKGLQLFESSYHTFGKLLDERIKNSREEDGWEWFYLTDEDGMMLRLTIVEDTGAGFKYKKTSAIDFCSRPEPLPDAIVNHKICLDRLLVELPYERLKNIFLGQDFDQNEKDNDSEGGDPEEQDQAADELKEEKPKKVPQRTVEELGYAEGDKVEYEEETWTILKISKDGMTVTLTDEEEDEIEGKVNPRLLTKIKKKKKKKQPEKEEPEENPTTEPEPAKKSASSKKSKPKTATKDDSNDSDDDDWDDDWED